MGRIGLLFDIESCTGCQTCVVACKQENQYTAGTWGIKVTEHIFANPNGRVQIEYLPFPTSLCTMCHARITSGEDDKPSCVKHCPTHCIEYGEVSELSEKMEGKSHCVLYAHR